MGLRSLPNAPLSSHRVNERSSDDKLSVLKRGLQNCVAVPVTVWVSSKSSVRTSGPRHADWLPRAIRAPEPTQAGVAGSHTFSPHCSHPERWTHALGRRGPQTCPQHCHGLLFPSAGAELAETLTLKQRVSLAHAALELQGLWLLLHQSTGPALLGLLHGQSRACLPRPALRRSCWAPALVPSRW